MSNRPRLNWTNCPSASTSKGFLIEGYAVERAVQTHDFEDSTLFRIVGAKPLLFQRLREFKHLGREIGRFVVRAVEAVELQLDRRDLLRAELERLGYTDIAAVESPVAALRAVSESAIDIAIVDLDFTPEGGEGIELTTREVKRRSPSTRVVILTKTARGPNMIAAIRAGADDYVWKGSHEDIQTQLPVGIEVPGRRTSPLTHGSNDKGGKKIW